MGRMSKGKRKHLTATYNFLTVIQKLKAKEFVTLLPYLSDEATEQISQCIKNAICSEHIPERTRNRLRKTLWKYKKDIRYIAKKSNSTVGKRKRLPKIGGAIADIISTVLPVLISLLAI